MHQNPGQNMTALWMSLDNESLNLADFLRNPMDEEDYLTLLVHLGIASVREVHDGLLFQATASAFPSSHVWCKTLFNLVLMRNRW